MFTVYKSRLPIVLGALLGLGACSPAATTKEPASGEAQSSNGHSKEQKANLANFDDLDYNVYSNQKWDDKKRMNNDTKKRFFFFWRI